MVEVNKGTIKTLIEYIASSLVEQPNSVKVSESNKEDYTVVELTVSPNDLGKVIGKNGQCLLERFVLERRQSSPGSPNHVPKDVIASLGHGQDYQRRRDIRIVQCLLSPALQVCQPLEQGLDPLDAVGQG